LNQISLLSNNNPRLIHKIEINMQKSIR